MAVLDLYFAVLASGVRLCLYLAAEALVLRLAFPAAALVFADALLTPDLVFAFAFWPALVAAALPLRLAVPAAAFPLRFAVPAAAFPLRLAFPAAVFALLLTFERLVGSVLPVGSGLPFLTALSRLLLALFILDFLSRAWPFSLYLDEEALALLANFERLVGSVLFVGSGLPCLTDLRRLPLALFILAFFMNLPKPIIGLPNL